MNVSDAGSSSLTDPGTTGAERTCPKDSVSHDESAEPESLKFKSAQAIPNLPKKLKQRSPRYTPGIQYRFPDGKLYLADKGGSLRKAV